MEFSLFIIPFTLIVVELLKNTKLDNQYAVFISVIVGALAGLGFGFYYGGDIFEHTFMGFVYGAAASGIYDAGKAVTSKNNTVK